MNADYFPVDNCVQNSDNDVIIPESSDGKMFFFVTNLFTLAKH